MSSKHSPIKAVIGLANPGPNYQNTRHNAGAWFVETLCQQYSQSLKSESKFFGNYAKLNIDGHAVHALVPTTFMNRSGQSVSALCKFFKLAPEELLIAHDELDFDADAIKIKIGGGHGGHNGLRDITKAINSNAFARLRIGIGHPGDKRLVSDYVLKTPSKHDQTLITDNIQRAINTLPSLLNNDWQTAMQNLHSN